MMLNSDHLRISSTLFCKLKQLNLLKYNLSRPRGKRAGVKKKNIDKYERVPRGVDRNNLIYIVSEKRMLDEKVLI